MHRQPTYNACFRHSLVLSCRLNASKLIFAYVTQSLQHLYRDITCLIQLAYPGVDNVPVY